MSVPNRIGFNRIIPIDKDKVKRVSSASEVTNLVKGRSNLTPIGGRDFGPSKFYRVNSGVINNYQSLFGARPFEDIFTEGFSLLSDVLTPDLDGYDIIVMAGQSNGSGSTSNSRLTLSGNPTAGTNTVYPYSGSTSLIVPGQKVVITGYTVTGTGFNGTGVIQSIATNVSITVNIVSTGTATSAGASITAIDYDDQLTLTGSATVIDANTTRYTYSTQIGTLPAVGNTVSVSDHAPNSTNGQFGFNGTGDVINIDTGAKTIDVNIKSAGGNLSSANCRLVVQSKSTVSLSDKVYTLIQTNNGVVKAFDPLPNIGFDVAPASTAGGRASTISMAYNYVQSPLFRSNRRVLIVQTSYSGRSFLTFDFDGIGWWNSTGPTQGGTAYLGCISRINSALGQTYGTSKVENNRIVAFCWQEGEGDASLNSTADQYKNNLINLANNIRTFTRNTCRTNYGISDEVSNIIANNMTFLVGGMAPPRGADDATGGNKNINDAGKDVGGTVYGTGSVPRSKYIDSITGITTRDVHFSGTDQAILGTRYASQLSSVVADVGNVPTISSFKLRLYKYKLEESLILEWSISSPSNTIVEIYKNSTNSTVGGSLINSATLSSGIRSYSIVPTAGTYYYAKIRPVSGLTYTSNSLLYAGGGGQVYSATVRINSQVLFADWTSDAVDVNVDFYSNLSNANTAGTKIYSTFVSPGVNSVSMPVPLVSRTYYYAVIIPFGGTPITSATIQQPITPLLHTKIEENIPITGSITPVAGSTFTGFVEFAGVVLKIKTGTPAIGQRIASIGGQTDVYILKYVNNVVNNVTDINQCILSKSVAAFGSDLSPQSITASAGGVLTVTSGIPVVNSVFTAAGAASGTKVIDNSYGNTWVVSATSGFPNATFRFTGPIDKSPSKRLFKLNNEGSITFPVDPLRNQPVYNSDNSGGGGAPWIGVSGATPGDSFTRMCWLVLDATASNQTPFGSPTSLLFSQTSSRKFIHIVTGVNAFGDGATQQNLLTTSGVWVHLTGTYDATTNTSRLYINGVEDTASRRIHTSVTDKDGLFPWKGNASSRGGYSAMSIGGYVGTAGQFKGRLDDIRIYPLALTGPEIKSIVNSEITILNLRNTGSTANTVTLAWDSLGAGITYNIKQSDDFGITYTNSSPSSTNTNSITITGLSAGTGYVFAVSAAGGVGSIINTSTTGGEAVKVVGTADPGSAGIPVDKVSGSTRIVTPSPGSGTATYSVPTQTGISAVSRRMLDITGNGAFTVSGDVSGGSKSVCFWMKARGGVQNMLQIANRTNAAGASTGTHFFISRGGNNTYGAFLEPSPSAGFAAAARISRAVAIGIVNNVIETASPHGFADNDQIGFDTIYDSTNGVTVTNIIVVGTTYFVSVVNATKFSIKDTAVSGIRPLPSSEYFSNIFRVAPVAAINVWVHIAAAFDSVTSTSVLYVNGDTNFTGKTIIPKRVGNVNSALVFPTINRSGLPADIIQIGMFDSFRNANNMLIDDFRIFNKVISESEIQQIIAGTL